MFRFTSHLKNVNKNQKGGLASPQLQWLKCRNQKQSMLAGMWGKGTLTPCWWERFLRALKIDLPYDPTVLFLEI